MTRRPPSFTLFPYTTLFRSEKQALHAKTHLAAVEKAADVGHFHGHIEIGVFHDDHRIAAAKFQRDALDRKSTRLNSSHTVISYAVFCLKKKNLSYRHVKHNR